MVRKGRGVAPHWNDVKVLWIVWWIFSATLDWRYWRFGLAFRAWSMALNAGPVSLGIGRPRWRWRVRPTTAGNLGYVAYQDWGWTITTTYGVNE